MTSAEEQPEPHVPEGEYPPPPDRLLHAHDGVRTVSDVIVERLRAWGVPRVFGYSGDGINGLLGALRRAGGDPAFVQARHEESAAVRHASMVPHRGPPARAQSCSAVLNDRQALSSSIISATCGGIVPATTSASSTSAVSEWPGTKRSTWGRAAAMPRASGS